DALAALSARLETRAKDESTRLRESTRSALDSALHEFNERSKRELAAIDDAKERAVAEKAHDQARRRLRALAREKQDAIAPKGDVAPRRPFTVERGAKVRIVSLDREGEIVRVRGERLEVRMGSATFTVARSDVEAAGDAEAAAKTGKPERSSKLAALAA